MMKKVLALFTAVLLLALMAHTAFAAGVTVYVTVSVDGKLEVIAQPVTVSELTVDGALKAAHAAFCPEGESGYQAGIDPGFNMFLINKAWGIPQTPFVILNDAPLGATGGPPTADANAVKEGDNIILCISSDPANAPATPVSLVVSVEGDSATVTATSWTLDFMTFQYTSAPFANAAVINPETGEALGTTDAEGKITVPAQGTVAVEGLAAIPVNAAAGSGDGAPVEPEPVEALPLFEGDILLQIMTFGGLIVFIPVILAIMLIGKKQEHIHWEKSRKI